MFKFNGFECKLYRNFKNEGECFALLSQKVKYSCTEKDGWNYKEFYKAARKAKEYGDIYIINGEYAVPCGGALVVLKELK